MNHSALSIWPSRSLLKRPLVLAVGFFFMSEKERPSTGAFFDPEKPREFRVRRVNHFSKVLFQKNHFWLKRSIGVLHLFGARFPREISCKENYPPFFLASVFGSKEFSTDQYWIVHFLPYLQLKCQPFLRCFLPSLNLVMWSAVKDLK